MKKYESIFVATTDTVPGVGAKVSPQNHDAIFDLKKRSHNKKLIIMIGNFSQLLEIDGWEKRFLPIVKKYWPGPYTFIVSDNLSLRMPDNNGLRQFITKLGPIYMTSANISGQKPSNLEESIRIFGSEVKNFYNFGNGSGKPSTIIDLRTMEKKR